MQIILYKTIVWGHHDTGIKTKDPTKKPNTNIPYRQKCKHLHKNLTNRSQWHIKKVTSHNPVGLISGISVQHISKLTNKKHLVILIDTEKAFGKIQHPSLMKVFTKLEM